MTGPDEIPDEVPEADAVEQSRPAVRDDVDDDYVPGDDAAPLESNESDWQEQRLEVDLDPEDDVR